MTRRVGLVVNPVAGLGGAAGLKGSDGEDVQREARRRGSTPRAGDRVVDALTLFADAAAGFELVTAAGEMGETAARRAGFTPVVAYDPGVRSTTGADTRKAVAAVAADGAGLILFAGGDGTARDVVSGLAALRNVPAPVLALGVPAGVKMYSSCFAVSPRAAGGTVLKWLAGDPLPVRNAEVLDIDEQQLRTGRAEPTLFGLLPVLDDPSRTQARKTATPASEAAAVRNAAAGLIRSLRPGVRYLLGPGGTTAEISRQLGIDGTPLGVDVILDGRLVLRDASEAHLLEESARGPTKAVVTIIGGQGFLLGRGNQQLSARVLRALGADPLLVVATEQKLTDLAGRPLLVDTGDTSLDARLGGYVRVITGPSTTAVYPVAAPQLTAVPAARTQHHTSTEQEGGR